MDLSLRRASGKAPNNREPEGHVICSVGDGHILNNSIIAQGGSIMRTRTVPLIYLALAVGSLLVAATAVGSTRAAIDPNPPAAKVEVPSPNGMNVNLEVIVDGKPVKLISHEGRLYLP